MSRFIMWGSLVAATLWLVTGSQAKATTMYVAAIFWLLMSEFERRSK